MQAQAVCRKGGLSLWDMGVYSITVHDFSHLLEQGVARAWLFFPTAVILGLDSPWPLVSDPHPASQPDRLELALELALGTC